jgi:hypothetical protein
MTQVLEHLPSKHEALSSKSSTTKKEKGKKYFFYDSSHRTCQGGTDSLWQLLWAARGLSLET